MEHRLVREYRSDSIEGRGIAAWGDMAADLLRSRELIGLLIRRDIAVRYRQSVLGYLWALLVPAVAVALFTYLTAQKGLTVGETTFPYPVFALWNLCLWQLFGGIVTGATTSLSNAGSMVTKVGFPKESLVLAAAGQPLFEWTIRLSLLLVLSWWFDAWPSLAGCWLPLALLPLVLLALGLGFFLSILNLVVRDTANLVSILLSLGVFAVPVFYPPPTALPFAALNVLNPLSGLLIGMQELLAQGGMEHAGGYWFGSLFAVLVFLAGWRIFCIAMPKIAERA